MHRTNKTADILLIDDNKSDVMLMQEAAKNVLVNSNIHCLHSVDEAIDFLNKNGEYKDKPRPDLILLDLNMPNLNGHDFLKIIKKDDRFSHIPVIVLTTSSRPEDIAESYRLHANCFIVKPVNFIKFKQIIAVINEFWLGIAALPPKDMD